MPKPLSTLQRRAQQHPTLTRAAATKVLLGEHAPYVHTGQERYMTLAAAVRLLGVDDALTLGEDKRGLLLWPEYQVAVYGTLVLAVALGGEALSAEERLEIGRLDHLTDFHLLPVDDQSSPLYRQMHEISTDLRRLMIRKEDGETAASVWRLAPDLLRRLFTLISATQAAMLLNTHPGDPNALTAERLRTRLAEYITDPDTHAWQDMRTADGAPVLAALRQAARDHEANQPGVGRRTSAPQDHR